MKPLFYTGLGLATCFTLIFFSACKRPNIAPEPNVVTQTSATTALKASPGIEKPLIAGDPYHTRALSSPAQDISEILSQAIGLAKNDPAKAFLFIEASVPNNIAERTKGRLVVQLGEMNLAQFPKLLDFLSDPQERTSAVQEVAGAWTLRDPHGIFDFAKSNLKGSDQIAALGVIADSLSQTSDFKFAAVVANTLPAGSQTRQGDIFNIVMRWTQSDPQAAVNYFLTLAPNEQKQAVYAILDPSTLDGPSAIEPLLKLVEGVHDPSVQNPTVARAMAILCATGDLEVARAWIDRLPQSLRPAAQASFVQHDQTDGIASLTPFAAAIQDQRARSVAIQSLASRLFAQSPEATAEWVQTLPEAVQFAGLFQFSGDWYQADPSAELQWLQSLPKGQFKDSGLKVFVSYAKSAKNEKAASQASQFIGK